MIVSGIERSAHIIFKENFINSILLYENGGVLSGGAYIDENGFQVNNGQVDFADRLFASLNTFSFVMFFTPDFAWDDGVGRYLVHNSGDIFSIRKASTDAIVVEVNNTVIFNVAGGGGTWSDSWVEGEINVLVFSSESGNSKLWLNGVSLGTSAVTYDCEEQLEYFTLGSAAGGGNPMTGSIQEVVFFDYIIESEDEEFIRDKSLISGIDFNNSLITLPTRRDYDNGSYQVTPAIGKVGIKEVLLGSDGLTSAEFPEKISQRRLGYYFDGSRQFTSIDSDHFTFSDGVSDQPFSFAALVKFTDLSIGGCIMSKPLSSSDGEYLIYFAGSGTGQIIVILIDDDLNGYIGKYTTIGEQYKYLFPVIVTYDGSGSSGIKIYVDGVSKALTSISSGSYTRMRNTSHTLKFGKAVTGLASNLRGELVLPIVYDFVLSPLQCKILSRKLIGESSR